MKKILKQNKGKWSMRNKLETEDYFVLVLTIMIIVVAIINILVRQKMFGKKTKKEIYDESLYNKRTYVNGETAIKPYWYFRNGVLHIRYNVDRCIKLSNDEVLKLKEELTENPSDKQGVLEKAWNFFSNTVGKPIIPDGVAEMEKRIKEYKNGFKN